MNHMSTNHCCPGNTCLARARAIVVIMLVKLQQGPGQRSSFSMHASVGLTAGSGGAGHGQSLGGWMVAVASSREQSRKSRSTS